MTQITRGRATEAGSLAFATSTVTSSQIPNDTQTGGAITAAADGDVIIENILINTDGTGFAGPTNLQISTDNANGATGAGSPVFEDAISSLGANVSVSGKDAGTLLLPYRLEDGKKLFIHGDDAAGTGAGVGVITIVYRRVADGATLTGADLTP